MSKLIKLPDGPYVEAASITMISEPVYNGVDHWVYIVYHGNNSHVVDMNATFVKSQKDANEHLQRMVDQINKHR